MGKLFFTPTLDQSSSIKEKLTIRQSGFKGVLHTYYGKSGDYYIALVPSLNTSGYGETEEEALEDLKYNLDIHFSDLFKLPRYALNKALKSFGWVKAPIFHKKFENTSIQNDEVLSIFDNPDEVKSTLLKAA